MNIEAAGQEAAQSETQSEPEDVQEEVKEEESPGTPSIHEDASGNSVKDDEKEPEDNNGNPEQPRAPASELPVTDEGSSTASTVGTKQADTFAVAISGIEHAEASASVDAAAEGDSVTITVAPEEGYQVQSFSVKKEDGTELEYSSENDEQKGTVLYTFIMPAGAVTADIIVEETVQTEVAVSGIGEFIEFTFDQEAYHPDDTVTAVLVPEPGYDVNLESIAVTDADETVIEYQVEGPDENGTVTLRFQAAETDMTVRAEASPWPRYHVTVTTEALEADAVVFHTSVEPQDLYEGAEVTVAVDYTGDQIWTATVTYGEDDTDLDFSLSSSGVTFVMPAADVEVVLSEREDQNLGDLSADDSSITGDWQGNTSSTEKEYEPDVELSKSARWTDIEDGYAELTITEKDTSDYANIPVDYIIILDRTRTMSLSNMTWEQGGYPDIVNENSPCINPEHYYYKGGISLSLVDYYTGFDSSSGVWFDDLSGGASSWTKRHYNASGQQISVSYENGCQDRLTMAKEAIYELLDQIAEDNADVPAGKIKSRVAFWSFADGTYFGGYDPYRERGLYNYTPWTEDYEAVKAAVNGVKTYSGTYYYESLKETLDMITKRNESDPYRAGIYTKVIFISDGICGDNPVGNGHDKNEVRNLAEQIKGMPNTDLFTLAIGMPSGSEGAKLLAELATQRADGTYTANFWQDLSFSGEKGSAFAKTLFSIHEKAGEIKAADKVLTDQIETKYWEPVEVVSADGGTSAVTLDKSTGKLTWRVPEGAGETYRCTIRLKLKDEYRYLLSDTSYPTNRDGEGAMSDPTKAGATMSYTIEGGIYNREGRKTGVVTPKLKYGTVSFTGRKNWTVEGSRTDSVTLRLMRTLPSQSTATQVNNAVTNASRGWSYAFDVRVMPDGSEKPLIKYDELGRLVQYEVTETVPEYYTKLDNVVTEGEPNGNGGSVTDSQLYNEPFKVKARLEKVDEETDNPLSGAVFSVYAWSEREGKYVSYRGTTDPESRPYETGTMTGASAGMVLEETEKGVYVTPSWLYYSPDNQGRFRVIETSAPEGYFGDWKEDASVTEDSTDAEKNVYDFAISPEAAENQSTVTITNNTENTFDDQRVLGRISFTKNDREAEDTVSQGDASLAGARYGLYAAEDILHQDQSGTVLFRKGEEIPVSYVGAENGVRTYRYDEDGIAEMTTGSGYTIIIENLELGSYYLKEEEASEGYLIDPAEYHFQLEWQGEKVPVVEISDISVYEQVKKQALSFYKVTGTDNTDRLDPMEGAKFSIYLVSDLADGKYTDVPDEDLPQAIIDDFRDPTALDYSAFRKVRPAIIYDEADSPDVTDGRLVKSIIYQGGTGDGIRHDISDYTDNENAYFAAELESDERGIVTTPGLPYGRYVVIETTTPENKTATRPFVIHVQGDDEDGTVDGDGAGTPLDDLVILMDRPVMALVRIEKVDSQSKKPVLKEGASYVIHDVDGAWFDYYTAEMTTAQKNAYKEQYGDLVVQYSQGVYLGTEANPYTTKLIQSETDETANVYIETPQELPAGTYELQELSAPEGYVLQGHEGVIAKDDSVLTGNHTYYETEEEGAWEETPQGVTRFIVSSSEAVYDSSIGAYIVTARQQNDPAIGKISIYAEGEKLASAVQEGSTILTRLGDALNRFFGYVKGLIGLDVPNEEGLTEAELSEYKDYVFKYEMRPIEGAQFEIRAAEDIYSPEGGANAELIYSAGDLVVTLTTDAEGKTWTGQEDWEGTDTAKGLPLGKYTVTQVKAGEGFALSEENAAPREIEIAYAGQEVPVIYRDTAYTNPRQKVRIAIEKQDQETGTPLAGAVFGLYAAENIQNYKGKTVVKAGTLLATAETTVETEEDGTSRVKSAVFAPDLPLGQYYVKELKAPYGYASSDTRINVDASYREDQREVVSLTGTIQNAPIRVQVNLMDYYTEVELDGAQLTMNDEDGNTFTTFLTVHEGNPVIQGLEIGKTYTLKELVSPEGYHYHLYIREDYETAEDGIELEKAYAKTDASGKPAVTDSITFTVLDEEELQIVSVFNKPLLGELTIEKTGEEAVGTTTTTDGSGHILETPVYELRGLPGAEYVLRAKEDIEYPDGYTGTLFKAGDVVLDKYVELEESSPLLKNYKLEIADGIGKLTDVSTFLGVKHAQDASEEEIEAFYKEHGSDVERQIPSEEEIADNETRFAGTPVSWVLRTNEEGLVRLSGLPLGEYEVIEVKAPAGYYRDKTECIQTITVAAPEDMSGRPEELVSVEVQYENAKQEIETPPEKPEAPKPSEIVYHPDVRITKQADKDVYDPGETVTYHITVSNTGDVDLENLRVDDSLAGGQIRVIDYLAVGEACSFEYEYLVPEDAEAGSRIDNTAHVIGTPVIPDPGTDEYGQPIIVDPSSYVEPEDSDLEKVFVRGAEIIVKKTADKRIYAPGDTAVYTIEVINPNTYDLTEVIVEDSLGGSFTLTAAQAETEGMSLNEDGAVTIALLPAGGKVSLRYEYQIPEDTEAGPIENLVTATGETPNPDHPVKDEDEETILIRNPEITITKKADKQVYQPGETAHYAITVTNTGDCTLTKVMVEEELLTEGNFVSSSKGTFEGTLARIGSLKPGESVELGFDYRIPEDAEPGEAVYNIVTTKGTTEPVLDPVVPELPDGTPNYLPEETVTDSDDEIVYVETVPAGMAVTKYSVDEGIRTGQAGAEFTLYAAEDVKNLHGTVIYTAGQEIETAVSGEDGIARFLTDVPVGRYRIIETKAPLGHYSSGKEIVFEVNKAEHNDNIHYLSFHDFVENAITVVNVKLVDDLTGNELAGASLQVTDPEGNPVEAWITKTSDGYTIKGLNPDIRYTITENVPRNGYLVNFTGASINSENGVIAKPQGAQVSFTIGNVQTKVTEDGKIDKTTIPEMTKIILENPFVIGEVRINKDGELLESWSLLDKAAAFVKSLFHYEKEALEGVEFTVYVAEDILHPDGVTGVVFHKGDVVAEGVRAIQSPAVKKTDSLGMVSFTGMYLGSYEIAETAAAEGFVRDTESRAFTLAYVDGYTDPVPAVEGELAWTNPRQKLQLEVLKTDLETGEPLAGAVIGLYTEEDIRNAKGDTIVRAGTLLESSETGADGLAHFESDLPVGYRYAVQEISAPGGYLTSEERQAFDFAYAGEDTEAVQIRLAIENQPNDVQIEVEKTAPEKAEENETIRYTVEKVRNTGNCAVDNFTLTDRLPAQVKLVELRIGTFSGLKDTEKYSLWYQTSQNSEYRLWKSDIPADENTELPVSELNLADGEEVTAFQYRFGTVNKGFTELQKPEYLVQVKTGLADGEEIVNRIELAGDKLGVSYLVEDETVTKVEKPYISDGGNSPDNQAPIFLQSAQTGDKTAIGVWLLTAVAAVIITGIVIARKMIENRRRKEE